MIVMTAKVDFKKILLILAAVAGVSLALVLLLGGGDGSEPTSAPVASVSDNSARVQFLKNFGWDVSASPVESGQVKIPQEQTEVYGRYNALQKSQGYDLTQYAGKTVMRYVYKINNYPNASGQVYATLLIYKNQVIGGDITDSGAKGVIQGFKMPTTEPSPTAPQAQETAPTQETQSTQTGAKA